MTLYPYGVYMAGACVLALVWLILIMKKKGMKKGTASYLALLALPLCVLLARLGFCLSRWSWFVGKGAGWFFRFDKGGFMMYGAMAGLVLACVLTGKITGQKAASIADCAAGPGMLVLSLSCFGDLLAGAGYGQPLEEWFSVYAFGPEEYSHMSYFHLKDISFFARFPFAVPDSFYGDYRWAVGMLMGLLGLCLTLWLIKEKTSREGNRAILGITMATALAIGYDCLRMDDVTKWGVAGVVKAGEVIGAVLMVIVMAVCIARAKEKKAAGTAAACLTLAGCMGIVAAMEFALEQKIPFLLWMQMDLCYLVALLACLGMILAVRTVWKRA
ncbi:MAG: prolipoprotein diacylglyceryl transferase [Clostridia bacterium]|nr:prolipoprotein diacylglyceryl transferase [Clostridia bacterium]MBR2287524.1 prolipoprotein diacylglyceryl transferase [Clostridia bacterium]